MLKEIQKHLLPLFLLADCQIGGWTEPQTFIKFCDIQNTKLGSISAWNRLFPSATGVLGFALFGWVVILKSWCQWWTDLQVVKVAKPRSHLHQKGDTHVLNMQHLTQCQHVITSSTHLPLPKVRGCVSDYFLAFFLSIFSCIGPQSPYKVTLSPYEKSWIWTNVSVKLVLHEKQLRH